MGNITMKSYFVFCCVAFLASSAIDNSVAEQADDAFALERKNIEKLDPVVDNIERLLCEGDVEALSDLIAEPFNLITPDGVYRSSFFRSAVTKMLEKAHAIDGVGCYEFKISKFSMIKPSVAFVRVIDEREEGGIVATSVLHMYGDDWRVSDLHISYLTSHKFITEE